MSSANRRLVTSFKAKQSLNLDPSYKTGLDILECFINENLCSEFTLSVEFQTGLDICGHSRKEKHD